MSVQLLKDIMGKRRSNYEGTITKRKRDGKTIGWKGAVVVGLTSEGREDRRWVSGQTAEEVRQKLQEIQSAVQSNTLSSNSDHTVESFIKLWLEHKQRFVRAITLHSYRVVLQHHCIPFIGKIKLTKLVASDLDRLYAKLLDRGLSTRVVRYTHCLIGGMLKQALRWDILARNVAEAATPPGLKTAEAIIWSVQEALTFLEHAQNDRLNALWYTTLFSGMRRAEVLGLQWENVNLEEGEILIRTTLVEIEGKLIMGEPKTRAGRRTIAITPDTVQMLKAHKQRQQLEQKNAMEGWEDSGFVFTTSIGTPINPGNLARAYKALIRRSGVTNIRFHDLRHTAASLSIRRGDSAKLVADRLGHTNVSFTMNTYVHIFDDQRRAAAFGLEDLKQANPDKKEEDQETDVENDAATQDFEED
jgi:integrase